MRIRIILPFLITFYFCLGITSQSFGQVFSISEGPSEHFSIDHFANDVYYYDYITGQIIKRNIPTWNVSTTEFTSIPTFANFKHLAVYKNKQKLYGYDFIKDSTFLIIDYGVLKNNYSRLKEVDFMGYLISPNDKIILFVGENSSYYSFADRQVYPVELDILEYYSWSSDTTVIIYGQGNQNSLLEYSFIDNEIDTLVSLDEYKEIVTYSYNIKNNILAYSINGYNEEDYISKLYLYYKDTGETKIVFNPLVDDSSEVASCWGSPVNLSSLNWSKDETELAFFSVGLYNDFSGIYIYDLDSDQTHRFTECDDYGRKYNLNWYNQDTLVFVLHQQTCGIDVTSPITYLRENENSLPPIFELLVNHPNPFNPTTTISFSIPQREKVEIVIYDLLGRKVTELIDETLSAGRHSIDFDGSNLSSGTYIYKITAGQFSESKKMVLIK